jgi:hypothetical protein
MGGLGIGLGFRLKGRMGRVCEWEAPGVLKTMRSSSARCDDHVLAEGTERVAIRKETQGGAGFVPLSKETRGVVWGERAGQGVVGRLTGRKPTPRPPGAQCWVSSQSTGETGQEEQHKVRGLLVKA